MKQTTFASLAWSNKGKVTKREQFHNRTPCHEPYL